MIPIPFSVSVMINVTSLEPMEDMRLEHDAVEDQEFLEELRVHGIRDPLECRLHPSKPGMFEVVDGRRRLRTAKILGFETVPCMVNDLDDATAYALAFSKNHHRKSINKLEEALWIKRMKEKLNLTDDDIATRVAKSRQWVGFQAAYADDYLKAPEEERKVMKTEFHARVLRGMSDEEKNRILEGVKLTGEVPSGRDLFRKTEATRTPQEILQEYRHQDNEFLMYLLQEEAKLTISEARNTLIAFRAKKLPWQTTQVQLPVKGEFAPPADDPTVKLYAELGKWYPLELIDIIAAVKPAKSLDTWQDSMRFYVRKLIGGTSEELKQKLLEEFMK